MIRKILFVIASVFLVFWFSIAYFTKNQVARNLKNLEHDNLKIKYENLSIGGFPTTWKIRANNLSLKLTNHQYSEEFIIDAVTMSFDLSFKTITSSLGQRFMIESSSGNGVEKYYVNSNEEILARFKLVKPLYEIKSSDNVIDLLKSLSLKPQRLEFFNRENKIFHLDGIKLLIIKNLAMLTNESLIQFQGDYGSENSSDRLNKAKLMFNLVTKSKQSEIGQNNHQNSYDRDIVLNELTIDLDQDKINMQGDAQLKNNLFSGGKFKIFISDYAKIIDRFLPEKFFLSKDTVKKIVAVSMKMQNQNLGEASEEDASYENANNKSTHAQFDLEFSKDSILIGNANILNFSEENEVNNDLPSGTHDNMPGSIPNEADDIPNNNFSSDPPNVEDEELH